MSDQLFGSYAMEAQEMFSEFEHRLKESGLEFVRACVYRSDAEQERLFAQGRTAPGRIVTWARAGQSKHNRTAGGRPASHAGDYYPLLHGKLAGLNSSAERILWMQLGLAAVASGLEWGGHWPERKKDRPHVQFKG